MKTETERSEGVVIRVAGPIVQASAMADCAMYELVHVGPDGLVGEVIALRGDVATIQVYEHTGGLRPGLKVRRTGGPLSVLLAPGLMGNIFDGIQRPLLALVESSGSFIVPGKSAEPLDTQKRWHFMPGVEEGAELAPGAVFGTVQETTAIQHKLLVPPHAAGKVRHIASEGDFTIAETVCVLRGAQGDVELTMGHLWPTRTPRPFKRRLRPIKPLITGQRVLDTLFPIAEGGAGAIPGDFGTGKTMTQHSLAKWADADVIVYVGCGERGNEMTGVLREFPQLQDPRTGHSLMERTVLIANTSNMPVAAREISIYTGITIAEYYRDMGYRVALMADSTSRWAEALREVSSRMEEMPAEEGYPAYLPSRLAEFYERAGVVETLGGKPGSITVVGAVSPPGGDFSEPVTQHTKRFTRCFWALDRELAHARHYPAISWLDSYSEYLTELEEWWGQQDPDWATLREEAMNILQQDARLQEIVKLVGPDALPDSQRLTLLVADLLKVGFLQQNALDEVDMYCEPGKQIMLLKAFITLYRRARHIIELGAPAVRIRELAIMETLRSAKSTIRNGDQGALEQLLRSLNNELDSVEREYT